MVMADLISNCYDKVWRNVKKEMPTALKCIFFAKVQEKHAKCMAVLERSVVSLGLTMCQYQQLVKFSKDMRKCSLHYVAEEEMTDKDKIAFLESDKAFNYFGSVRQIVLCHVPLFSA